MLIELYGENFGCFRDEFCLSMMATNVDPGSSRGVVEVNIKEEERPLRLLRAAAVYGPNASGKSTVLQAANVLRFLLEESARFPSDHLLYYTPFVLDGLYARAPVKLGVRGVIDGCVYDYFVRFDSRHVAEESLQRSTGKEEIELFSRVGQEVSGPWKDDPQFGLLSEAFRPNALLLSLADALTPKLAGGIAVGLRRLVKFYDPTIMYQWGLLRDNAVAGRAERDKKFATWLRRRLSDVDIGVVDFKTKEVDRAQHGGADGGDDATKKSYRLELLHGTTNGPVALTEFQESTGTRRFLDLSPYFFDVAHSTETFAFFVDELDASLHPSLLDGLIRHFNCQLDDTSVCGQLVFATHETSVIDHEARDALLRRDQVYLTEKGPDGAARLYSVVEFKERINVNMRRRYLQGRYGGLPSLGDFSE